MITHNDITDDYDGPWKEGLDIYFRELIDRWVRKISST